MILVFDRAQMFDIAGPGDVLALIENFDPGKRHRSVVNLTQRRLPAVAADRTALYLQDGSIWTAGGLTTVST